MLIGIFFLLGETAALQQVARSRFQRSCSDEFIQHHYWHIRHPQSITPLTYDFHLVPATFVLAACARLSSVQESNLSPDMHPRLGLSLGALLFVTACVTNQLLLTTVFVDIRFRTNTLRNTCQSNWSVLICCHCQILGCWVIECKESCP